MTKLTGEMLNFLPCLQERVTNLREHREFEKEFEVKTALTGERNLDRGADVSHILIKHAPCLICLISLERNVHPVEVMLKACS